MAWLQSRKWSVRLKEGAVRRVSAEEESRREHASERLELSVHLCRMSFDTKEETVNEQSKRSKILPLSPWGPFLSVHLSD